jgi:adenine-specific DNA-methyltransferase
MAQFSYMGTKRRLAGFIADKVNALPPGPFLDLFSGVSAAGMAVSANRQVWCNDIQHFSCALTKALYTSNGPSRLAGNARKKFNASFTNHRLKLLSEFGSLADLEQNSMNDLNGDGLLIFDSIIRETRNKQKELRNLHLSCLFTTTHSGTYFGFLQSVEIDSIRHASDISLSEGEIDSETHLWILIALCRTVSSISNSTGHFAQYLTPKPSNISRVMAKRKRSVWQEWKKYFLEIKPIKNKTWRKKNRIFQSDANILLQDLQFDKNKPTIIYADPPYTEDQYSRFYHVLESVILYDYPIVTGKGEYRIGRFTSDFSLAGRVSFAFEKLIRGASKLDCALMISYPSKGLMLNSTEKIMSLLSECFAHVQEPLAIPLNHSTMGASKGSQTQAVDELIFLARH